MPQGTMDIEEIIEKMQQFSEANSEKNKNTLEEILKLLKEQKSEIAELKKKITDLETDLKAGKFGVSGGTGSSAQPTPTPSPDQTTGGGSTPPGPTQEQQKEAAWNVFFTGKNDITDKEAWKKSGLTIEDAQKVCNNGWNKPNVTEHELDGQKITNIEPLNHKKDEIEKAVKLLNKIKNETNLSNLLSDKDIEAYDQSKVPSSINYDGIKKEKNSKLKSLFKTAFEGGKSTHGLSDDDIDKWRTSDTGLSKNGTDERKAVDNGWADKREEIKNAKLASYKTPNTEETETNIDVLEVVRAQLDTVNGLVKEIKATTTFKQIDDWKTANESKVGALMDNKLPESKQQKGIWNVFQAHRNTFKYRLNVKDNEVEGDGLKPEDLQGALNKEKEKWQSISYKPVTNEQLNRLIELEFGNEKPVPAERMTEEDKVDLVPWLVSLGGYRIDQDLKEYEIHGEQYTGKQVWDNEEAWIKKGERDKQGTLFLPYLYSKFGFKPDELRKDGKLNKDLFCVMEEYQVTTTDGKKATRKRLSNDQGFYPFPTAAGKSTKFTYEIAWQENVIIVLPFSGLAEEVYNYHTSWLRKDDETGKKWNCVYHERPHWKNKEGTEDKDGSEFPYEVALNDLVNWKNDNDGGKIYSSKGEVTGKYNGLSVLEPWAFNIFLNRELVKSEYGKGKDLVEGTSIPMGKLAQTDDEWDKWDTKKTKPGKVNKDFEKNVKAIKDKLIPKEETVVMFDEMHETDPEYQKMQDWAVRIGYNVIRMTATSKGKRTNPETGRKEPIQSSITTSYPRKLLKVNKIDLSDEELSKGKILIFFKEAKLTDEQKAILEDKENINKSNYNPVFYAVFDETTLGSSTGITKGAPPGSVFVTDRRMSMGYSPWVDIVILLNRMVMSSLGTPKLNSKGQPLPANTWDYGEPEEQGLPIADIYQEGGRVARLDTGSGVMATVLILNNFFRKDGSKEDETEEIDMDKKKDLASKFIETCLSGTIPKISSWPKNFKDANFLRAAIAYPEMWGRTTAEILCGLGTSMSPNYPFFGVEPGPRGTYSEKLWKAHIGKKDPIQVDTERAEQVLLLQTQSYLAKQAGTIQDGLSFKIESPLIKEVGWRTKDNEVAIAKLRSVLNKVISEKVGDKIEFGADEKHQFLNAVAWRKASNGVTIAIIQEYKDKAKTKLKDNLTISFSYGKETRVMKKLRLLEKRTLEIGDVERKKEGLITSICEECGREFPFHKLIPNDHGELFCREECFRSHQEGTKRAEQKERVEKQKVYEAHVLQKNK